MAVERPIIFNAQMVQAILSGHKTMTRRVVKPQPTVQIDHWENIAGAYQGWVGCSKDKRLHHRIVWPIGYNTYESVRCPYGEVGDKLWVRETFIIELWVRETFIIENTRDCEAYFNVKSPTVRLVRRTENDWDGTYRLIPHYRATEPEPHIVRENADEGDDKTKWSPSIFMPKWAARIRLEITNIRVERVQEMTSKDCIAEGYPQQRINPAAMMVDWFKNLWDSINAKWGYGWLTNPYVWVIEFKRSENV